MWSDDDLVERYHEISRMLVFLRRREEFSANVPIHDPRESEVLYNCMQRQKDRRLREHIEDAMRRFYAYRAGLEKGDPTSFGVTNYEDAEMEIVHLPSLVDNEYGIAFKKTGEFGVYGFFVSDSGKFSCSHYRSDALFKERKPLLR